MFSRLLSYMTLLLGAIEGVAADAAVGVAEDDDGWWLWFTSSYMGPPSSPLGLWSHDTIP